MKLREINNPDFFAALNSVMEKPVPAKTAYSLVKIQKKVSEHLKMYDEARMIALKKFANLDEKDQMKVDENRQIEFKDAEAKAAAIKEIDELLDQEVEVPTINVAALADVKIESKSLLVLEKIITE